MTPLSYLDLPLLGNCDRVGSCIVNKMNFQNISQHLLSEGQELNPV